MSDPAAAMEAQRGATRTAALLLIAIASVSLLVGGISIMNVLIVSVTERTREIGIRRVVGARARDIRLQFLSEALLLCLLGGIVGIAGGMAVSLTDPFGGMDHGNRFAGGCLIRGVLGRNGFVLRLLSGTSGVEACADRCIENGMNGKAPFATIECRVDRRDRWNGRLKQRPKRRPLASSN